MSAVLALLALSIAGLLWLTRAPRRTQRDCAPLVRCEREEGWRVRFMADADDYLAIAVRGAAAKRRMLIEQRTRAARSFLPAYRPSGVQIVEHFGVGPRTRREVEVRPLRAIAPLRAPTILRKRPRLTLAR